MTVPLLIDGTGVTEIGLLNLFAPPPTVEDQIAAFKKLAYDVNGDIHTPNFLRLVYGDNIKFDCLLSKLTITRQSFDRDGSAVRGTTRRRADP